jgi:hypothetical protein
MSMGMFLLYGLAFYAAAGLITAVLFVLFGVTRMLAHPVSVTIGARILFIPGAALMWPLVLGRWLKSRQRPS